jgi:hypothetical protein
LVLDEPSPPAAETLEEVEPEEYYTSVGNDGRGLRVPADLDASICRYLGLSAGDPAKFDRATFWLDMTSRQWKWNISASASFAAFVSAIEALPEERGAAHQFDCPVCGKRTQHEERGAIRRVKDFLETYAPGAALAARRGGMYALRSGILHGSKLIEMDYALPSVGTRLGGTSANCSGTFRASRGLPCTIGSRTRPPSPAGEPRLDFRPHARGNRARGQEAHPPR